MTWQVIHLRARATFDEGWRKPTCNCGTVPEPHGEPLWASKWDCEFLKVKEAKVGPDVWEGSYQGNPTVSGGCWLKNHPPNYFNEIQPKKMNLYLLVDPALAKTRKSDNTAIVVIGLGTDQNFYLIDMIRTRMDPIERASHIFRLHRKWYPIARVGYEAYGLNSDIVHLQAEMERENYRFNIIRLGGQGEWHNLAKPDRIRTLLPQVKAGRWWLPKPDWPGREPDLKATIEAFVNDEWMKYPGGRRDDGLDVISRINDPGLEAKWPTPRPVVNVTGTGRTPASPNSWMY